MQIPSIGVEAPVVPVGLLPNGAMDAPKLPGQVGWFSKGVLAGGTGSAVLTGHLDRADGQPAVFWRLKEMKVGDEILVKGRTGDWLHFVVQETAEYPYDNAPLQRIFGGSGGSFLNLVTCAGDWNRHTYDKRLVVYAALRHQP